MVEHCFVIQQILKEKTCFDDVRGSLKIRLTNVWRVSIRIWTEIFACYEVIRIFTLSGSPWCVCFSLESGNVLAVYDRFLLTAKCRLNSRNFASSTDVENDITVICCYLKCSNRDIMIVSFAYAFLKTWLSATTYSKDNHFQWKVISHEYFHRMRVICFKFPAIWYLPVLMHICSGYLHSIVLPNQDFCPFLTGCWILSLVLEGYLPVESTAVEAESNFHVNFPENLPHLSTDCWAQYYHYLFFHFQ